MIEGASGKAFTIKLMCEGCGVCKLVCPTTAITVDEAETGTITVQRTIYGFECVTGKLWLGEHNSGLLVSNIRNLARRKAQDAGCKVVIIDAAPGIGCPVIASITGADYLIAVTEPTPVAKRNLERLFRVAKHFRVPTGVVINRVGRSYGFEKSLEKWVKELGFQFLGSIPFDQEVVKALVQMKPVIDYNPDTPASRALIEIAEGVEKIV
ncbi:MAG TPA: hypothetical protein EYP19_15635 [Desulfobacterales bacterium]|nr:hypothetical protein [Desulfobacterales bacterium]